MEMPSERRPPVFFPFILNMSEVPRAHIFVEDTRDYPEEGPLTLDLQQNGSRDGWKFHCRPQNNNVPIYVPTMLYHR